MMTTTFRLVVTVLPGATLTGFRGAAETHAIFKSSDWGHLWIRSDAGRPGRFRINAFGSANGVLFAETDAKGVFASSEVFIRR